MIPSRKKKKLGLLNKLRRGGEALISGQTCSSSPYQQTQSNKYLMLLGEGHAAVTLKAFIAGEQRLHSGEKEDCRGNYCKPTENVKSTLDRNLWEL